MGKDVLYDDPAMSLRSYWYLKQIRDNSGEQLPLMASLKHMLTIWFLFLSSEWTNLINLLRIWKSIGDHQLSRIQIYCVNEEKFYKYVRQFYTMLYISIDILSALSPKTEIQKAAYRMF